MKKLTILTLIVAFAACTNDTTEDLSLSAPGTLRVCFDNQSRVELDYSCQTVWTKGDKVSVFHNSDSNDCYEYQGETGEREGILLRTAQGTATTTADKVVVVYPYNENYTISHAASSVDVTIPAVQYYKSGSYGVGANLMVATGTGDNFSLKSLCGWVKLQFKGSEKLTKITLRGNNDEQIAGSATANYDNYTLALIAANLGGSADGEVGGTLVTEEEYVTEITLDLGEGVQLTETPTYFYFTLAPQTFTKGITVTATADNGTYMTQTTNKEITISRNAIQPMTVVDYVGKVDIDPTAIPDNEIWYTTTDGKPIALNNAKTTWGYPETDFGAEVISHNYKDGKGVISFNANVTKLGEYAFMGNLNLVEIYLPDNITTIEQGAFFSCQYLEYVYMPKNLSNCEIYAFSECWNLTKFGGYNISEDGKCLIIDDTLYAFAHKGTNSYVFPNNIKNINKGACRLSRELESISLSEGLESIGYQAFEGCTNLKFITLPQSLQNIANYAFIGCTSLEGFYGNERFHTADNRCLLSYANVSNPGPWLVNFAGAGLTEYTIPDEIKAIENYAFNGLDELTTVTIPASVEEIGQVAFYNCNNLESVYGPNTSEDHRAFIWNNEFVTLIARKGITATYHIPNDVTKIGYAAFQYCKDIEQIKMGDQITHIDGYAFADMPSLKSVRLSASLKQIGYPSESGFESNSCNIFDNSSSLEEVYFRSLIPPFFQYANNATLNSTEYNNLTVYVPKGRLDTYKNSDWAPFAKYMKEYEYTDLPFDYISTDYSADGDVTTLQTATEGAGVDIVLMGDGYSDRQIADGTYKGVMQSAYEKFFSVEPYKSHKELFNVYYVTAVSTTEGYEYGNTALSGYFGDGTLVGGSDSAAMNYALNAIDESRMEDANIVVMMNSGNYAGTCYMYYPSQSGDYGRGVSVSYFPVGTDSTQLEQLLHHEACGHGFAKLADEYAYESMGAVAADYVSQIQSQQSDWGWWKNVDFTSDPAAVLWAKFIADSRYSNEGLGAFEGGLTYWTGVWRPTENSIMRYNTGGFNAPSREAIYYRINKLAYGDSWQYDYEEFVEWDAINRTQTVTPAAFDPLILRHREPTVPPVVVGKTWREALQK